MNVFAGVHTGTSSRWASHFRSGLWMGLTIFVSGQKVCHWEGLIAMCVVESHRSMSRKSISVSFFWRLL